MGLQNELVTTMYETAHILNPLFHHNFIAIYYHDNQLNMRKFILVARDGGPLFRRCGSSALKMSHVLV